VTTFDATAEADALEGALRAVGTPERAEQQRAYLKSDLEFLGATVPQVRDAVRAFLRAHPAVSHDELIAFVEALWAEPINDRRVAVVVLLELRSEMLIPADLPLLERLLLESGTWAYVDSLAASAVGSIVERHPRTARTLDRWIRHPDFWLQRAAMLALLVPLRRGEGDWERFSRYADSQLDDTEFFIRKAIGWVLRDTGKRRPELVFEWLLPRAARASGITYREAIKPLSAAQREELDALRGIRRADPGTEMLPPTSWPSDHRLR
jgi:3-methyladenine DNA glycosylase AlkD